MKHVIQIALLFSLIWSNLANGHHSFAMFNSDEITWLTGKVVDYRFAQPHVTMKLEVETENGSTEVWVLETDNPKSWDEGATRGHAYHPSEFVSLGDQLTASGWANRRGLPSMLISSLINEEGVEFTIRTGISGQKSQPDPDDEEYLQNLMEQIGSD